MNQNNREPVEPTLADIVERYREMKRKGAELIQATMREEMARQQEQRRLEKAQVEHGFREVACQPGPGQPHRGVHFTELPEAAPGQPLAEEWNTYRRQVRDWLANGLEGRHVLIKGGRIIGIYDTAEEAEAVGWYRYQIEPYFVHPIRAEEPFLRIRGVNYPWPTSRLQ